MDFAPKPLNLSLNTRPKGCSLFFPPFFSFSPILGLFLPLTPCPTFTPTPHVHPADSKGRSPFLRVVMAGRKKLTL